MNSVSGGLISRLVAQVGVKAAGSNTVLVRTLLVVLVLLQVLDFHSTVSASREQVERNQLLNWLSLCVTQFSALATIKVFDVVLIAALFWVWTRTAGRYDTAFASCLAEIGRAHV